MSSATSICTLRRDRAVRLSGAVRYGRGFRAPELAYRNTRPLVRTVQPPAPRIVRNTVHQTVVHLHQTTHRHILNRLSAAGDGRGKATLLVRQTALPPGEDGGTDPSRPALAARRMLRILSAESARQTLRPFYQTLLRELLDREREEYRGKPARSLLLVQSVVGRRQMLTALRRFYRQTAERLDGAVAHSLIYWRYVRHIRQEQGERFVHRYAGGRRTVPEDPGRVPPAGRFPSPPQPPEREPDRGPTENIAKAAPLSGQVLRLSGAGFRLLVRGVADALGRQSRVELLRRGGM